MLLIEDKKSKLSKRRQEMYEIIEKSIKERDRILKEQKDGKLPKIHIIDYLR
jgi:hypothetical protein